MVYLLMLVLLGLLSMASWLNFPSYFAILAGTLPFIWLALHRGYSIKELTLAMKKGFLKPLNVYVIVTLLGATIAMWLASGALPLLIYLSIQLIHPNLFILCTFLVTWFMTAVIGSAIGTTGMVGVLFISLARAGHVSLPITAGAVLSGIYLGERSSFVSSCANLVAELCHMTPAKYIKTNLSHSLPSILLVAASYFALSFKNPIQLDIHQVTSALEKQYQLHYLSLLPLLVLTLLLIFKVKITKALIWSTLSAFLPALFIEHYAFKELLQFIFWGYQLPNTSNLILSSLHNNGLWGMFQSSLIVMAASLMTGLFENTSLLSELKKAFHHFADRYGNYSACLLSSIFGASIGCSQTFAILFSDQMLSTCYDTSEKSQVEKSQHLADTAVVVSGLIPWNLAAAVPLSLLDVNHSSLIYAVALYLLPFGGYIMSKLKQYFLVLES